MFRLINLDLSTSENLEIEATVNSLDEAKQHKIDHYYFMYEVQEYKNGEWIIVEG